MRINKYLSAAGACSRRAADQHILDGEVTINGRVAVLGDQVEETDEVCFQGEHLCLDEPFVLLAYNKPVGLVCSAKEKDNIIDAIGYPTRIYPVGRLDKDTEGLLVLTNDGQLAHRVLSPKKHVPKTYYAKIEGVVTEEDIKAFAKGVTLDDGYETMPAELVILKSDEISEIELTIHEGKFHQVKRMFESVDKKVIYLKRLSMGKLKLDENLALGEYRELTDEEVKMIEERD